jgi:hypothetical protein
MVDTSGPGLGYRQVGLDGNVQLGRRFAKTRLVDIGASFRLAGLGIVPDAGHAQDRGEHEVDMVQVGHADRDWPEAAELALRWHGAALP